jgi:2-phosphoglycolate phosphatase
MKCIKGVLFDLDGTLLNTAPDLVFAINQLRLAANLPELPHSVLSPIAGLGSKAMIQKALDIDETDDRYPSMREKFLDIYTQHIADSTHFFPEMDKVLAHLDEQHIPWGIVTNKLTIHTKEVLKKLNFLERPGCVICGDTLSTYKPHPEPILHACKLIGVSPEQCLYVGDAATDVAASKAAGTHSLVALYGYIGSQEDPYHWEADGYIKSPIEIIDWLKKFPQNLLS